MDTQTAQVRAPGGAFLIAPASPDAVFTPEDLTDDQRMVQRTVEQFIEQEVLPRTKEIEQQDWALTRQLISRSADLGVMGADLPEASGGSGLD